MWEDAPVVLTPGAGAEALLVSKGVMGFLGDLRGRNSKSPPNPLGLAERRSLLPPPAGRSPSLEEGGLGERGKIEPNPQSYARHAPRASGI